ncbi:carboxypeptidase-like regulatory domain-containing protein [Gillisia sp. M10.2A]|uniref:Carboxypeptidase-like regulatory domain-containing protein n=1 Tax=Gillisia lutea TaxID=2909668 RepID=A0ABS9EFZ9_9FLAO|nr:carboxypeptidase-like regulatory domain-containing protein [Gillisia lutea]MCF4101728.1 carboxypeptidase-like regulatory domain-containing protein [Gillisia lutea]
MKTTYIQPIRQMSLYIILSILCVSASWAHELKNASFSEFLISEFIEFNGRVVDSQTGNGIASAHISIYGSNISTVTNSDGYFSLKVPDDMLKANVTISFLGYKSKTISLSSFSTENNRIELEESVEELSEVNIFKGGNARGLVKTMLDNRDSNYLNEPTHMKAFYRETIRRGRRNVSLSEAVVDIYKQAYSTKKKDDIALFKARKSTDYKRLDTLALKLRGGPFNTLYVDVMKYTEFVFQPNELDRYKFSFDQPTKINNRYIYVIDFSEINHDDPWYYGKLYIDAENSTLVRATYKLNVQNRLAASEMFVKSKPKRAKVYPVDVSYQVDYRESNGKWYYSYGNALLEFVVNWKHKLFNSHFTINSEMVITDWAPISSTVKPSGDFIKPSVIMVDDVSGFRDTDFWGDTNIIEPEKSIQNAIEKIQRQLKRNE